jgi:3-isopropylmalate dehydratase small subunit
MTNGSIKTELKKDDEIKVETEKKNVKPKISKEEEFYMELEKLWSHILNAASIGNTTACRKKYLEILNTFKKEFM